MADSRFSEPSGIFLWPIAALRICGGVFFAYHGISKISRGGGFADGLAGFLGAQKNTFGFYQSFVESVVLPNKALFAVLVAWGELALGVALILGLATRYAAFAFNSGPPGPSAHGCN